MPSKVLEIINENKKRAKNELPPIGFFYRTFSIIPAPDAPVIGVYLVKATGEILVNKGDMDLEDNDKVVSLGPDPFAYVPESIASKNAFKKELSEKACTFLLKQPRPIEIKAIQDPTPLYKDLARMVSDYYCTDPISAFTREFNGELEAKPISRSHQLQK